MATMPQPNSGLRTESAASNEFVILPGQEQEFRSFSEGLQTEFAPEGLYQDFLFRRILHAAWNIERCRKAERQLYAASPDPETDPLLAGTNEGKCKLISFYMARAERSFSSAVKELRHVQTEAFYRNESGLPAELSPLMDTKAVVQQLVSERLRGNQADLTAVRAMCEAPPPAPPPPPAARPAPAQAAVTETAQAAIPTPAAPVAPAAATPAASAKFLSGPRGGFSRNVIFKRNSKKNRQAAA